MKRFFSVETNSKKNTSEKDEQNQVEPSTEILLNENPKRNKVRSSPDPKWMGNGNNAWLEYRDVNGIIFMFCKWCKSKNYANELAKGTRNYRKQSIDRHLNHHEHKAEAEAKKNQNIMAIKFSLQLATDACKIKTISQMQCIYFAAKKYLALSVYPDLYQFIDFHQKNSEVMKLCDMPEVLQLPSHLSKNLPLESNEYGSHLSDTSAKDIEEAIVYVIEKALYEEIRSSVNWSVMIDETNSITDEKHLAIVSRHMVYNVPVTQYLGIINLDELNAEAITLDLKNFFIAKGLEIKNLLHFCSDGAATLIGKKTGVVKRFQEINPFITSVHCIAHRLHLAGKDAAKHVPYFNHYETCIKRLYTYFSSSYQRMQNLRMVQDILEDPQLTILNIVNTRWLSMSNS
ncbi:11178_t:CDS:1, partial [Dentiscutata heterogama]